MARVDALVLAGAPNNGRLRESSPSAYEALIDIQGRPMIAYVVDALLATPQVGRIGIVGPVRELQEALPHWKGPGVGRPDQPAHERPRIEWIPSAATMGENIARGIAALRPKGRLLIATSDIPLITPEIVTSLLRQADERVAEVYYPIVPKEANEAKFPGVERTYVQLLDGTFTGGNLVLVEPSVLQSAQELVNRALELRKHPFRLSRLLGLRFLVKLALHRLTVAEVEAQASRMLGCRSVALVCPHPEVGIDVDKPSDLAVVSRALTASTAGAARP